MRIQRKGKLLLAAALTVMVTETASSSRPAIDDPEHEYAPIVERTLDFHDFTFKTLDGGLFNLREYAKGKRLVLVNFSAAWCKNSNMNGPIVQRFFEKYKDRGLGVVLVMEYSGPEETQGHLDRVGLSYPVAVETDSRDSREKTTHFMYRTAVGDKRKWGTPFYVFIDGRDVREDPSAPLASRVYTVSGEMVESEAENFIEARLNGGRATSL